MCSFILVTAGKEPLAPRGKCKLYLSLKPNSREEGVVLLGGLGVRDGCRFTDAPSQALQEEGVAGGPSGTVAQLADPGSFPHRTLLAGVTLQTAQRVVISRANPGPHWVSLPLKTTPLAGV